MKTRKLVPPKSKRPKRILGKGPVSHYHVVTHLNASVPDLGEAERAYFRSLLTRVSGFCGVALRAFCVEPDQVQLLVGVAAEGDLTDKALIERARMIYPKRAPVGVLSQEWIEGAIAEGGEVRKGMRAYVGGRMASLSMFMKILNQRFALFYNRTHQRCGTLWADIYRSTLVENAPRPLATVAAYIDLRPVRSELVNDPVDYPYSSLGETWKKAGALEKHPIFEAYLKSERAHRAEMEATYRHHTLIGLMEEGDGDEASQEKLEEKAVNLLNLPKSGIIGSPAFIEDWVRENKDLYYPRRPGRPKKLRGEDRDDGVHTLR